MSDRPEEMDEHDVDARFASIVAAFEVTGPDLREHDDVTTSGEDRPDALAPPEHPGDRDAGDDDATADTGGGASGSFDPDDERSTGDEGPGRDHAPGDRPDEADTHGVGTHGTAAGPDDTHDAAPADPGERDPRPWVDPVNPSPVESMFGSSSWRTGDSPGWRTPDTSEAARAHAEREEEHYDPPAVQLPPQEDLHFWGAVVGLVAGPLMLLWVAMARPENSTRWFTVALVLSLVGFALLVLRQPRDRDQDDDGARV
ncbi:hypothetical protein KC207_07540 [Phycicoccus sp. BSK3Z-2]|uniref:Uncharacterized protein n=1 Tax=Phycicoccus avicenniae TaxID=2828860 RepID=A0A941D7X5_9MICO|nr:hypothetical protein [Phycicoccus avicenniae]MBR7743141.1 hypothetical protein [Phycicoccus avicenniae]